MRVDAVLDELGHRLEGVALGESDDGNGIPVVADPKLPTLLPGWSLSSLDLHRFPGLEMNSSGTAVNPIA